MTAHDDQKQIRKTVDKLVVTLQKHHFSDASIASVVQALVKHGVSDASQASTIAILCGDLKRAIRWHATASHSAAYQMALSVYVSEEFYRDWEKTSRNLENWIDLYTHLCSQGVLVTQNLWHAILHIARNFDRPSHLRALAVALEKLRMLESQGSSGVKLGPSEYDLIVEKFVGRLEDLSLNPDDGVPGREGAVGNMIARVRAAVFGDREGDEDTKEFRRGMSEKTTPASISLSAIVDDVEAALDQAEKARIGKNKAG
ncbi:hypothetical protein NMY22_g19910 [Coprinellus aureogranulatus]|nr:hypothetical protein NMY22_g19910 [Coprinellus aureogranulatus]